MDYCYCGQATNGVWSHLLSGMAGSALTLLGVRLHKSLEHATGNFPRGGSMARSHDIREAGKQDVADRGRRAKPIRRMSTASGSFTGVDGEHLKSLQSSARDCPGGLPNHADHVTNKTSDAAASLETGIHDDKAMRRYRAFDEHVVSKLSTLEECKLLLHRTRVVSALTSPLMAAPDEESCYEVVTRLLVPFFGVDRCSYALMTDAEHIIIKAVDVKNRSNATKLGLEELENGRWSWRIPIKGTMIGKCHDALQQQYCPRTKDGEFDNQKKLHSVGVNSVLATPIIVNGNKFTGCIIVASMKEDAFREYDKLLIQDLASMLGANIYSKRMRRTAEKSNRVAREMLHSMIPETVIEKIEVFWDRNSEEYQQRRSLCLTEFSMPSDEDTSFDSDTNTGDSGVSDKIEFLQQMNADDASEAGCVLDTPSIEIRSINRALYAENVKDVVIVFSDIVGFSKLALKMKPLQVMDVLHALFCRFDALCDKHGVKKLETVGDAYLCTSNLFDGDQHGGNVKVAALHALNMAKDMVLAATQEVILPTSEECIRHHLSLRVGIHVGEVNCGVLGERLPKFSVFGNTMNIAARMEQSSKPNRIRVTEAFHSLVADVKENEWGERETVTMKNMGDMSTYIMDASSA